MLAQAGLGPAPCRTALSILARLHTATILASRTRLNASRRRP